MHKITKTLIHIWISIVSLGAFVFSWVLLAHSPKPAPLISTQTEPNPSAETTTIDQTSLQPIPSLNDYLKSGSQQTQTQPSNVTTNATRPRLRTRGS